MVDVLLGTAGYAIEEYETRPPKVALVEHLTAPVGEDLRTHTGRGTSFNNLAVPVPRKGQSRQKPP